MMPSLLKIPVNQTYHMQLYCIITPHQSMLTWCMMYYIDISITTCIYLWAPMEYLTLIKPESCHLYK